MTYPTKKGQYLYRDVPGWFTDEHAAVLDKLIQENEVSQVIEIGSYLGKSAVFFGSRVLETLCIDPFVMWPDGRNNGDAMRDGGEDFFGKFKENIINARSHGPNLASIKVVRKTSEAAFHDNLELYADLIYVDGQHDYVSVKNDLLMWSRRAKKVICGDDYDENWPELQRAVDEVFPDRIIEGRIWYKII